MKNIINIISMFAVGALASAQVVISESDYTNDHAILSLVNPSSNEHKAKGLMLPLVDDITQLPLYDANEHDLYTDDPTMEGMVMYVKEKEAVMVYDGEKWKTALDQSRVPYTRASLDPNAEKNPRLACVVAGCGSATTPFGLYSSDFDVDELGIISPIGEIDDENEEEYTYSNFTMKERGFYRIFVSLGMKTSGLHVSTPILSYRAKKNDFILTRREVPIATAILIHAGANRVGTMEFVGFFDAGDTLTLQVTGAVSLLTVADVYEVIPGDQSFIKIEKLY
ncbi:hypothetical protein [Weeksella sp. HMSC059D05]|uniref:hypothetical protein n=1 Tax=Weeksella sp. HMSC059D05 TaxID=1715139 RepID=UPI0008A22F15|nr:hypothetical protein [Weeksella sp. HMSC059D05]OFM82635.1 hypothetical protein HMPREF2660_02985 [Weeksella sp. HMSC059D05]